MDYIANLYNMSDDKLSQEVMNLNNKLMKVNPASPIYTQLLDMLSTAESVRRERIMSARFKQEDKVDSAIEIGSIESVVYTPIYSQEEFIEVVAKMYIDKKSK